MCRVAVSQPRTNRVHVDMLPSVWMSIKSFWLEETKKNKLEMYHDHDVVVPTVKRGVFMTTDKRIQLATVERQTEPHHKVERAIAYTREHIIVLKSIFWNWCARPVPEVKIGIEKSCTEEGEDDNNQPDSWSI
jgi:hypothetical protein